MRHKKMCVLLAVIFVFTVGIWTAMAAGLVEQRATLSGQVVSVIPQGTSVQEGDELIRVSTLAGSASAARANVSGVVKEVLVQQGAMLQSGAVVVRIEAN